MLRSSRGILTMFAMAGLAGCNSATAIETVGGGGSARLTARPHAPTIATTPGTIQITTNPNDGFLIVPPGYDPSRPMPLVVGLHGAGGGAGSTVSLLGASAQSRGFLLLAVGARGLTWDAMTYKYSYDVTFIDDALKWTFDRVNVDPKRVIIEGFSDGATYALGLALANGDLFTRSATFSPGFIARSDSPAVGKPEFFDSHGRQDPVLDIDRGSRAIVKTLQDRGYTVTYMEFDGGHTVPSDVLRAAVDWWMR